MKSIALSGYYGFGNAGDEAVLAGLIRAFRGLPGGVREELNITALSIDPHLSASEHGIRALHRYTPAGLVRAIAGCDLLASGGGSLLQDVTSRHSIFYYLGIVRAAQLLGKRTMFLAQGIGPLTLGRSRRMVASVACRCDAITVRDGASAALLGEIGVTRPMIEVTADPALLLGESTDGRGVHGTAISLRAWPNARSGFASALAHACREVLGAALPTPAPLSPSDLAIHNEFAAAGHASGLADEPLSWSRAVALYSSSEMVIGMRLHALILAAACGVPSTALSYDPKIAAFMNQSGQGDAIVDVADTEAGGLEKILRRVWESREERAVRLADQLPHLKAAAARNAAVALSLLENR